jgi:hypothetical protein
MRKKPVNYVNNKDLLREIHRSKASYCYAVDESLNDYDLILNNIDEIVPQTIEIAIQNRAIRLAAYAHTAAIKAWDKAADGSDKPKIADFKVEAATITAADVVIRVMTYNHIPLAPGRKKTPKTIADQHAKCNFHPFKHYMIDNDEIKEVVRSHWSGGFDNGHFDLEGGRMTDTLGRMMLSLCQKYAKRYNWRNYSYNDEMQNAALVQLANVGLRFNEDKGQNPFAYYTTVLTNSFTGILNNEKRAQRMRDDLLQENGIMPSFSRQAEDELFQQRARAQSESEEQDLRDAGYNF